MRGRVERIGWVATITFAASYLVNDRTALRRIQALAALLWVAYGVLIHALLIVVADAIVAGAALVSSFTRQSAVEQPVGRNPHRDWDCAGTIPWLGS